MKGKLRRTVDILMTAVLLFLMGYQFWGKKAHEWVGMGIFILFIAHHILNFGWYKNLLKGKYPPFRIFQIGIDVLVLISMLFLMYSSVILSRYVFSFLPIESGLALARRLHILGSHWGFLLMSFHMGLHWNMVLSRMKRKNAESSCGRKTILFFAGLTVAFYGGWVFVKRNFITYLFLRSEFVFLDYEEPKILFYLEYLSLMGTCIFVSHYLGKLLCLLTQKRTNKIKNKVLIMDENS